MDKRYLLHDLEEKDAEEIFGVLPENVLAFPAKPDVKPCIGCFGCWVKTPGKCVISDRCAITPALMASCREMTVVSRLTYGGFSPAVKMVLDRSIGYIMPFFRIVKGEMHHTMRYETPFQYHAHFYAEIISQEEQALARQLVQANATNFGAEKYSATFHETKQSLKEAMK